MPSFTLTKRALIDLVEIGTYTQENWGCEQRNNYLTMPDGCFQQLAANPLLGKDCSDIREGYRKMSAGRHVIFYRQKHSGKVEIVRILHGHMDIDSKLAAIADEKDSFIIVGWDDLQKPVQYRYKTPINTKKGYEAIS